MYRFVLVALCVTFISYTSNAEAIELNLVDLMNAHYGAGSWSHRTGLGAGTDIGPALADGLNQLRANGGRGIIHIPAGIWEYTTPVDGSLISGNYIIGEGSQASVVVFNSASGAAFQWTGAGNYTGGGMRGIAILLEDGLGDSNSYAVLAQGDSTVQPDQMEFEDIYISALGSSSYWWAPLQVYGNARTTPQGIRVATFKNIQLFRSHNIGAYFSNIVQFSIENLGTYTGKPGTQGMDVWLTGGGTPSTNSIHVSIRNLNVNGALHLTNITDVALEGTVGTLLTDNTADYVSGRLIAATVAGVTGPHNALTIFN